MQIKAANHQGFRSAVSSRIRALLESLEARCLLSAADDGLPADDYSASLDAVAYEMPLHAPLPESSSPESGGIVQGDINADGRVDGDDYYNLDLAFHGQEGQIPEGSPLAAADLNADGRVDALDYFILDSKFVQQLLDAPAAPSALVAEPLSTNEIELTWADNSANETNFTVERRQAGLSEWAHVVTLPANSISYTNELLLSGTQYHYRVCASNANGHSAYAILASATTLGTPPLYAVTNPAAPASLTALVAGTAAVELQWQDSSNNEDAFIIQRQLAGSDAWLPVTTVDASTESWIDTGLADATSYIYRIAARNLAGTSAFATASAVSLPALPAGGVAAVAASSSQINLSWTDNSANETGYAIERKTGQAGAWGLIATVAANTTSYANTGLTPATQYLYRVRANSPAGNSGYSAEAAVTTLALSLPAAPTTLTATAASTSQVNLAWTDNAINETGYVIERKTGPAGTWAGIITVAANATSYQNTGLSAATQYFFRVRAVNGDGNSSNSAEVGVTTLANVPAAPSALVATAVSPDQINLVWVNNATNQTGYGIERKVGPAGTWSLIATVGANATSYAHTGLSAATQYVYRVRATNAAGPSAWSAEAAAATLAASTPLLHLSGTVMSAREIRLSWADNSEDETGFRIARSTDGTTFSTVAIAPADSTVFADTGVDPDTTYYYTILATGDSGDSAPSNIITAKTAGLVTPGAGWTGPTEQPAAVIKVGESDSNAMAIARWDVVPYQTFDGLFNVGVVAFHINGIERVSFSVNGGEWTDVYKMTVNPQTANTSGVGVAHDASGKGTYNNGVVEYWATLQANDFAADGPIEVRAIAYPEIGVPRVLAPLSLNVNSRNASPGLKLYVSPTGSDTLGAGTANNPYATVLYAARHWVRAGNSAGLNDATIYLAAGSYTITADPYPHDGNAPTAWMTITPAPGVDRKDVMVSGATGASYGAGIQMHKVHWKNVTFAADVGDWGFFTAGSSGQQVWIDGCNLVGPGEETGYQWWSGIKASTAGIYITDSDVSRSVDGVWWADIARNVKIYDILSDAFRSSNLIINSKVTDVHVGYSGANLTVDPVDNTLVTPDDYTPIAKNVYGSGYEFALTGGNGWTPGAYRITEIVNGKWRLNSSPAPAGTTGGQWRLLTGAHSDTYQWLNGTNVNQIFYGLSADFGPWGSGISSGARAQSSPLTDIAIVNTHVYGAATAMYMGGLTTNLYVLDTVLDGYSYWWKPGPSGFEAVDVVIEGTIFRGDLRLAGVTIK